MDLCFLWQRGTEDAATDFTLLGLRLSDVPVPSLLSDACAVRGASDRTSAFHAAQSGYLHDRCDRVDDVLFVLEDEL